MNLRKLVACVKRNKHFLITTHTNLEGDALGSELAFFQLLKAMGKRATIVNQDELPSCYSFLAGSNKIKKYKKNLSNIKFDCFVVLDCSDLKRTGEVFKINTRHRPILNIDHHISNTGFADINWIDAKASSCAEMIYKLYKKLHIPINKEAALYLYVGILCDTGSFRYTNTSHFTHKIASDLLKYDLDIAEIYRNVYENISFSDMQLLAKILPTMRRQFMGKVAWFQIKQRLLKNKKISFDLSEHVLSFARAIKDVEVAVLFKENLGVKDEIRVNLRSQGKADVNKIAHFFGGGGHKTAAGCTINGRLEQVRRRVLRKIQEYLK